MSNTVDRINGLDLFSGIGGNTLALRDYIKTVAYCEADRHAQSVLLSRMGDGSIEPAPIWDDVTTLSGPMFDHPIDIIIGGFPCQDISVAGDGSGLDGKRSGLVFEIFRLVGEIKPAFVFLENVSAIRTRGGERVVKELAGLGYDCRWDMLSAFDVGAPHKRERWFLLGYANGGRQVGKLRNLPSQNAVKGIEGRGAPNIPGNASCESSVLANTKCPDRRPQEASGGTSVGSPDVADTNGKRLEVGEQGQSRQCSTLVGGSWWSTEPNVGRVAYGVPLRVDRLKRLGNAVVPLQAKTAFERLMNL